MTENPSESQRVPQIAEVAPAMTEIAPATAEVVPAMTEIVVTVDHVYLPFDDAGNIVTDWTVTSVSTTRVSRRTRLKVPAGLAEFLSKRDQAEIV